MPDASPDQNAWWLVLAGASLVVVVVALLLGLVINVLRQIDRHAARTHTVGKQIAENTVALWMLEQTNRDLVAIRDAARAAGREPSEGAAAAALSAVSHRVQGWLGGSDTGSDSGPSEDRGPS